jgi:hypothetical protein
MRTHLGYAANARQGRMDAGSRARTRRIASSRARDLMCSHAYNMLLDQSASIRGG